MDNPSESGEGKIIELAHLAEYARSDRSTCKGCQRGICKGSVRFAKLLQSKYRDGKDPHWYHPRCFVKKYNKVTYLELADFETLRWNDQEELRNLIEDANIKPKPRKGKKRGKPKKITAVEEGGEEDRSEAKRPRLDPDVESIKEEITRVYTIRDKLEEHFGNDKKSLATLIQHNGQTVPTGIDKMVDFLADMIVFGALKPCDACGGQLMYKSGSGGYQCTGYATEYSRCAKTFPNPERLIFKLPDSYKSREVFKGMKFSVGTRTVPKFVSNSLDKEEPHSSDSMRMPKEDLPLNKMTFILIGSFSNDEKEEVKGKLEQYGGQVFSRSKNVTYIVSKTDDVASPHPGLVNFIRVKRPPILASTFVNDLSFSKEINMDEIFLRHLLSDWYRNRLSSEAKNKRHQNDPRSTTYPVAFGGMRGGFVDWRSGFIEEEGYQLFQENGKCYDCLLSKASVEEGTNSYYKIQIITTTSQDKFWLFRAWGRIDMSYGNQLLEENLNQDEALEHFRQCFREKTGNDWTTPFEKKAGLYDIMSTQTAKDSSWSQVEAKKPVFIEDSDLNKSVQELLQAIFSKTEMERTIKDMKVDLGMLPLTAVHRETLNDAVIALNEASDTVERKGKGWKSKIVHLTNKFYTKIPHRFDANEKPVLLDNKRTIDEKIAILDTLTRIEETYATLKAELKDYAERDNIVNIQQCYHSLSTEFELVRTDCSEYTLISQYFMQSQSPVHNFKLVLHEVFRVSRTEEATRVKELKRVENHRWLWHGSRITNFASILRHGLTVTPPGYSNFSPRGIFFADVVTKSARYCGVVGSSENNFGHILLCEVALGKIFESVDVLHSLPDGFDSVKVRGKNETSEMITQTNGVQIPNRVPKKVSSANDLRLQHNEYVIFNEQQASIKYLIKFQIVKKKL